MPATSKKAIRMRANKSRLLMRPPRIDCPSGSNRHPPSVKTSSGPRNGCRSCFRGTLEDLIGRIGAEQPGPVDRDLIAHTKAVLRFGGADAGDRIAEGLHRGRFKDELLIEIEEVLQAYGAAIGVGAGVVEFRVAGQGVGLEVDADVLQYARVEAIDQGLRVAEADEEVGVGDQRARQARDQAVLRNDGNSLRRSCRCRSSRTRGSSSTRCWHSALCTRRSRSSSAGRPPGPRRPATGRIPLRYSRRRRQ